MLGTTHGLRSTSHIRVHHLRALTGPRNTHIEQESVPLQGPHMLSGARHDVRSVSRHRHMLMHGGATSRVLRMFKCT